MSLKYLINLKKFSFISQLHPFELSTDSLINSTKRFNSHTDKKQVVFPLQRRWDETKKILHKNVTPFSKIQKFPHIKKRSQQKLENEQEEEEKKFIEWEFFVCAPDLRQHCRRVLRLSFQHTDTHTILNFFFHFFKVWQKKLLRKSPLLDKFCRLMMMMMSFKESNCMS